MPKKAIIIGAGPAGLTAAYELLQRTNIIPIVLEKSGEIGGISRTINYKGNRMDMGPHRFFSKSDRVMDWWLKLMPLEESPATGANISYQNKSRHIDSQSTTPKEPDKVMLLIRRLTRIYFLRKFFAYPIQLSLDTLRALGLSRTIRILFSFLWIRLFPRKPENSLEDFIINRFGKQLYLLFFKDYTEKVWGIPPASISAEWGAQRIKGVSLSKAIAQAIRSLGNQRGKKADIHQKGLETSLIEQFLYPKYGPGSLWEEVARRVHEMGGEIHLHQDVAQIKVETGRVCSLTTIDSTTNQTTRWEGDYFFSSMPVQELITAMGDEVPADVYEVAAGLQYRDFINVGILLKQLSDKDGRKLELKDNWIYIQERDVKVGRLMIYNNWGGGMIKDPDFTWIGMEYFCNKTDDIWCQSDETIRALAIQELERMALGRAEDVLDSTVRRMEKTYPAYFGTYDRFETIRHYTDTMENLFLVGRNGMHKYNNADHSMLTAMVAVDNIAAGVTDKANIWAINTEQEYHEEKQPGTQPAAQAGTRTEPQPQATRGPRREPQPMSVSFGAWLFNDNKTYLWVAAIAILLQFIVFKYLYPFPSFINGDSYVYLQNAYVNSSISTYPIGYPRFLRLFSVFSSSDTALVAFQYLLLQTSSLWLIFSLCYFHRFTRFSKNLLFAFVVFNPAFLYVANMVTTDALFTSLSITWFTLLLWTLRKPTVLILSLLVIVIFLAFIIRYNALYYPVITALALLLSPQKLLPKLITLAAIVLVLGLFISDTSREYYEFMGIRQFSPFSGWQIANNALHGYRYVDSADRKPTPPQFQELDGMVRHYFDTTRNVFKYPHELLLSSTYYMWNAPSPLQQYVFRKFHMDSTKIPLKNYAAVAPLYYSYGTWLIRQYPGEFFHNFLVSNMAKYYSPQLEFLEKYNGGTDTVARIAALWFHYKNNKVYNRLKNANQNWLDFYPILIGCLNVVFILSFLCFAKLKGFRSNPRVARFLWITACFWLANFGFSVFSAPMYMRYQLFQSLLYFATAILMFDYICLAAFNPSKLSPASYKPAEKMPLTGHAI